MTDMVNYPPHYNFGRIEVITVLEDWQLEFHEANAVKYIARAKHKRDRVEDLEKAIWYLTRKVQLLKSQGCSHTTLASNEVDAPPVEPTIVNS